MKLGNTEPAKPQTQRGDDAAPAPVAAKTPSQGHSLSGGTGDVTAPAATAPPNTPQDALMIVVAGGAGAWFNVYRSTGGGILSNDFVSKKIELPKNWEKLVQKYKSVVPTHARY